ncbi:unnamed protein product [Citrullus colocynthis]|uniref:PPM-type phosphatase domain-containing protein n=1 Tax=Citrullus colocynthis TaxID=252529 RepID=A0ABP0XUQ3_9ROSI
MTRQGQIGHLVVKCCALCRTEKRSERGHLLPNSTFEFENSALFGYLQNGSSLHFNHQNLHTIPSPNWQCEWIDNVDREGRLVYAFVSGRRRSSHWQIAVLTCGCSCKIVVNTYCSKKFHELLAEEWIRSGSDIGQNGRWEMALTKSYGRVDDAFKVKTLAPYSVGSTSLVVLLSACQIIVANCGDSRALLCRGSQAVPLTADHKISRPDEYDRLVKGGARILFVGCPRVEGVLTMTRAIGDHYLKPRIISEPEMACSILRRRRRKLAFGGTRDAISPAQYAANQIRKVASHLSGDNISVVVIDLKHEMKERQSERLLRGLGWAYLDNTLVNGAKATIVENAAFNNFIFPRNGFL